MNILFVESNNSKKNELLYKHIEGWAKNNNEIYVLSSNTNKLIPGSSVHYIQKPIYCPSNIILSWWFSMINHPRIDLVITEFSFFPFRIPNSRNVVYFQKGERNNSFIIKLVFSLFYKRYYFLVPNTKEMSFLQSSKIKSENIYLLTNRPDIFNLKTYKNKKNIKRIVYIDVNGNRENLQKAISVFNRIDRKDENWSYRILVKKENEELAKQLLQNVEMREHFWVGQLKSLQSGIKEFESSMLLLKLENSESSNIYDLLSLHLGVPILIPRTLLRKFNNEFSKAAIVSPTAEVIDLAMAAHDYVDNLKLREKFEIHSQNYLAQFSWKKISRYSLDFLESI